MEPEDVLGGDDGDGVTGPGDDGETGIGGGGDAIATGAAVPDKVLPPLPAPTAGEAPEALEGEAIRAFKASLALP